jgi:hypothetical protein
VSSSTKTCARCGKSLPRAPERRVYSQWTRSYYCAEIAACDRRVKRLKRKQRPAVNGLAAAIAHMSEAGTEATT